MPAVSIILACDGSSAHLGECLRGIAAQTFTDYEVLCVVGGLRPGMDEALERVAADDARYRIVTSDIFGRAFAWADAAGLATAPYVLAIDGDTVLEPTMLERLSGLASRLDLDVALCNGTVEGATRRYIRSELLPLHEVFSADEAGDKLSDAVPPRSWERLYRTEWLKAALADDAHGLPVGGADEAQLAEALIARAERIDYLDDVLVHHYEQPTAPLTDQPAATSRPAVTVLMPSLNVAPYIRQAVDSVLAQTLQAIEVLCIDAGSDDGTLEILREYERRDPRVHVIVSDKRSYGHQMNLGLAAAKGEYIGIVETDDFADPEMFEMLYQEAKRLDAQVVKGNYWDYRSQPVDKNVLHRYYYGVPCGCLLTQEECTEVVRRVPGIWSAIYQTRMLRDNGIDFRETPGASYQDTAFTLKVWTSVERAAVDGHAFLHYRNDNAASSVKQIERATYINDEFLDAYEFCVVRNGSASCFTKALRCRQAVAYLWNYERLTDELRGAYAERMRSEFADARDAGELDRKYFWQKEWDAVHQIMRDPDAYVAAHPSKEYVAAAGDEPLLTLVVNVCGYDGYIDCCCESLANQDFSGAEVLLVDDRGSKTVSEAVERLAAEVEAVSLVQSEGASVASLMREAIGRARGTWLLFVEGNAAFELDSLQRVKDCLAESTADMVLFAHDECDIERGELVARGKGVDLGSRRGIRPLNATSDARSILQVADAHVANKAFRREFVSREGLDFIDSGCNCDIAFCELGLLHASAVEVGAGAPLNVMVGMETPRDMALRKAPQGAVDSWCELLLAAKQAGLYDAYERTLVNAAATQLADDMESVRASYDARAKLCEAIAGEQGAVWGIAGRGEPFYASKDVWKHMQGAALAAGFAAGQVEDAGACGVAVGAVREALNGAGVVDDGLVEDAVQALCEDGGASEYLWWCLPADQQQALEQLVGSQLRAHKALAEADAREMAVQAELDAAKHELALVKRELATTKKELAAAREDLKAQEKQAIEDIQRAEEEVRSSRSYRLGNAFGAPLRAVRSVRDKLSEE